MGHVISKAQPGAYATSTDVATKTPLEGSQPCKNSGQATEEDPDSDELKHSDRLQAACVVEEMAALRHKSVELLHSDMEKLYSRIEELHAQLNHCAGRLSEQDETLSLLIADANTLQDVVKAYASGYQLQPINEAKHETIDDESTSRTAIASLPRDSGTLQDHAILERLGAVETAIATIKIMVEGLTQPGHSDQKPGMDDPSQTVLAPRSSSAPVEQSLPQDFDDIFNPDEAISTSPPCHTPLPPQKQLQHDQSSNAKLTTVHSRTAAEMPSSVIKPRKSLFGEHNLTRKPQSESGQNGGSEARSLPLKRKAANESGHTRSTRGFETVITSDCALASGILQAPRKVPQIAKAVARRSGREHKPNPLRVRINDTQINTSDSIAELAIPDSCQLDYGALYANEHH